MLRSFLLCATLPLLGAADNLLQSRIASAAQAIEQDDYVSFCNYCQPNDLQRYQDVGSLLLCRAAIKKGEHTADFIKKLVTYGVDVNKTHQFFTSTLHVSQDAEQIRMQGANGYQRTHLPIEYAIWAGNVAAVQALLNQKADIHKTTVPVLPLLSRLFLGQKLTDLVDCYLRGIENERALAPASQVELLDIETALYEREDQLDQEQNWLAAACVLQ